MAEDRRPELPYPNRAYAWYVIGVLMLVTLMSFLDRQLPSLLLQPIRTSFGVSDTQMSLLQGYGFAVVYTVMGLPFGRVVDRSNRRNLIVAGIVVWSAMTVMSGFAASFGALLLCRMGVGIGEACLAPAAFSLIADYVEPRRHGRALGVYYASLAIGSGASLLLGGFLLRTLPPVGPIAVMGFGAFDPWQLLFVIAGTPGFLVALLLFTVREVPRRELARTTAADNVTVREFLRYVGRNGRMFAHLYGCYTFGGFVGYATVSWAATFYLRRFGMPLANAGMIVGALGGCLGILGSVFAGFLSDRWNATLRGGRFRVPLLSWAIVLPAAVLWTVVDNPYLSEALFGVVTFGSAMAASSAAAVIQAVVPNRMRGQAIAGYLFLSFLFGFGLGPTAVALVTDYVFHNDMALGYSLIVVPVPVLLLAALSCWTGLSAYDAAAARLRKAEA